MEIQMTKRSSSYVCTVDANDPQLASIIEDVKSHIKMHNAKRRVHELESPEYVTYSWSGKQQVKRRAYIRVRGRLGKSNPNAELYRLGGKLHTWTSQDIKLEHSQRVDIYVSERRNYTPVAG
jgi:hypothetical protein